MTYQPRYAEFARVRGFDPGNEPSANEFISWIRLKWALWAGLHGRKDLHNLTPEDHASFDAWLKGETE